MAMVKAKGSVSLNSSRVIGVDTGAPGRGRAKYGEEIVSPAPFWLDERAHPGVVVLGHQRHNTSRPVAPLVLGWPSRATSLALGAPGRL